MTSCFPLNRAAERKNARLRERAILQSLILGRPVDSIGYDDRWFLRQRGFQVPQTTSGFESTPSVGMNAPLGSGPHEARQRQPSKGRLRLRSVPRTKEAPIPTRAATASNLVAAAWEARVSAPSLSTQPAERHDADLKSGLVFSLTRTYEEERFGVTLHSIDHVQPPIVSRLTAGGSAEAAGLRVGDVILSIAGTHVQGHEMATNLLLDLPVGEASSVVVRRVVSGSAPSSFKSPPTTPMTPMTTPMTTPKRGNATVKADEMTTPSGSSSSSAASAADLLEYAASAAVAAAAAAPAASVAAPWHGPARATPTSERPAAAADVSEPLDQTTHVCSSSADTAGVCMASVSESVSPTTMLASTPMDVVEKDQADSKTTCAAATTRSESPGPSIGRNSFPSSRSQPMPPKPRLRLAAKDQAKVDRVSAQKISALELKRAQERVMAIVRMQAAARRRLARREFVVFATRMRASSGSITTSLTASTMRRASWGGMTSAIWPPWTCRIELIGIVVQYK